MLKYKKNKKMKPIPQFTFKNTSIGLTNLNLVGIFKMTVITQ